MSGFVRLCGLICTKPMHAKVGSLVHVPGTDRAAVYLEPAAVIPLCKMLKEKGEGAFECFGSPFVQTGDEPYLQKVAQRCKPKDKRINMGYGYTRDDAEGRVTYSFKFDVDALLKDMATYRLHLHTETQEEQRERMGT